MITTNTRLATTRPAPDRLRATQPHRHVLLARIVAGLPLLGIGLSHAVVADVPMRPLVEAAGFPFAAVLAPVAVAFEIIAGILLLLGAWARIGGALAAPTMLGAIYAHLAIEVWPNGADMEPPLVLPLAVLAGAGYVVWRGAGRWSLDSRALHVAQGPTPPTDSTAMRVT